MASREAVDRRTTINPFTGGTRAYAMQDPTRSFVRVQLTDLFDPGARVLPGMLNPEVLRYSIEVDIGELNPVGWSGSVLQYGHTKSPTVPLELYFSTQLNPRLGGHTDLTLYIDWFSSFCYPTAMGKAPSPMLVVWPDTLEMAVVFKTFNADFVRFHSTGQPAAVRITIEARELRHSFRDATMVRGEGLRRLDSTLPRSANTGSPLNLRKGPYEYLK